MPRPNIRMMNRLRVQESSIQAAHVHKFPFQCLQYSNTSNITFLNEEESYCTAAHKGLKDCNNYGHDQYTGNNQIKFDSSTQHSFLASQCSTQYIFTIATKGKKESTNIFLLTNKVLTIWKCLQKKRQILQEQFPLGTQEKDDKVLHLVTELIASLKRAMIL